MARTSPPDICEKHRTFFHHSREGDLMPELMGYRCKSCGEGFVIEVLTKDEVKERRKAGLPTAPITCSRCGSNLVERTN